MEMADLSKNPRKHIHENSPQFQELMKIYEEGHRNKSCPPSLFDIIITIIILIIFITLIIIS